MEHKHTPGPWEVATEAFDNEGFPETVIQALCGSAVVAVALDFGENNPGMREHNARLIASAPDLLEALQESDNQLREVLASITDGRVHHDGDEFHLALAANRAAIARATKEPA